MSGPKSVEVHLSQSTSTHPHPILPVFHEFYESGQFCDIALSGHDRGIQAPIPCHKLVLASTSGLFRLILTEDTDWVHLADIQHDQLRISIDQLYQSLSCQSSEKVTVKWPFGLDQEPSDITGLSLEKPKDIRLKRKRPERKVRNGSSVSKVESEVIDNGGLDLDEEVPRRKRNVSSTQNAIANRVELEDEHDANVIDNWIDEIDQHENKRSHQRKRRKKNVFKDESDDDDKKPAKETADPEMLPEPDPILVSQHNWLSEGANTTKTKIDLAEIRRKITNFTGSIDVNVTTVGLRMHYSKSKKIKELTTEHLSFHALCGIATTSDGILSCRPLAWTHPDSSKTLESQFDTCVEAFKAVFGISTANLINSRCILLHQDWQGRKQRISNVGDIYKRLWNKCTREDLKRELEDPELVTAFTLPKQNSCQPVILPYKNYSLTLCEELETFHDIVVISAYNHGIECRKIEIVPTDVNSSSFLCMKVLLLVWGGGLSNSKILQNDKITEAYMKYARLVYRKKTSEKLLATEGELPRPLPTFTCHICGKTMTENANISEWSMHKRQHLYEFYRCDCKIKFKSFRERKCHYDQVHSLGKDDIEDCLKSKKSMPSPVDEARFRFMCHSCGEEFPDEPNLGSHASVCNGYVRCEECKYEFVGLAKYFTHMKHMHPRTFDRAKCAYYLSHHPEASLENSKKFSCDKCPKTFLTSMEFKIHWRQMHGSEEDRPYKCAECGKSFVCKPKLKYHLLNIHIRSRPFVCRYQGCKSDFNCSGNLYAHEKKVHGRRLGATISINKVVTDEEMLQYSYIQGNAI